MAARIETFQQMTERMKRYAGAQPKSVRQHVEFVIGEYETWARYRGVAFVSRPQESVRRGCRLMDWNAAGGCLGEAGHEGDCYNVRDR
jgi:hypothetical protein